MSWMHHALAHANSLFFAFPSHHLHHLAFALGLPVAVHRRDRYLSDVLEHAVVDYQVGGTCVLDRQGKTGKRSRGSREQGHVGSFRSSA